jgi:xylose isomerase
MPFWPIQYSGVDPFGGPILESIDSLETANLICWGAEQGLLEQTSAHDDDLVPWDPVHPDDDLDEKGPVHERIMAIRQKLDQFGVNFHAITCSLHGHPMFRRGGLTNPNEHVREAAKLKVRRTMRIGNKLGAKRIIYWVARDGYEVLITVPPQSYIWLKQGLNDVTDYNDHAGLGYEMCTIESKPNEPRGRMFLPTAGHAAGFTFCLKKPDFWKVNPELPQHEAMTGLDMLTCARFLVHMGKLGFLHFGNQISGQFDNDFPPLVGPDHLKQTVDMFRVLNQLGWRGVVEFDCHPLRCELDPEKQSATKTRFIENCSRGLGIALALSNRLQPIPLELTGVPESEADHISVMQMCNLPQKEIMPLMVRE